MKDQTISPAKLVAQMTHDEKAALLSGFGMWKTNAIERFGIPSVTMTDGTYGVRYSIPQIDGNERGGTDLDAFLAVVNQRADDIAQTWGVLKPATCFPNGSAMGCSWDVDLMNELGDRLATECRAMGIDLLLGPGINIRRTPLAGRSYEYYSEDPLLTGHLSAALINGLQAGGIGASLKHFACNNSEIERTSMDSIVEERALREIYLRGFEIAVEQSRPWTVMSSYNRLNGVQASEDPWLLDQVLRQDWGFEGVVISDWHGIKDRPASLVAGGDLDMPESPGRRAALLEALEAGTVSADLSCKRMLELIAKASAPKPTTVIDTAAHHADARRMAVQSMVLLKNDGVLPLTGGTVLVVGSGAVEPVIQGSGCATTLPTRVDIPLEEMRALAPAGMTLIHRADADAQTLDLARAADRVVVFASTEGAYDGEGSDRTTLALGPGQDAMIEALAAANPRTIVALAHPDAVVMPWKDRVSAIVSMFYSGQAMGGAIADILLGAVNPSGKLSVTFPEKLADVPGHMSYPGENGRHVYSESIHVGYRGYDKRETVPLFPFGFGLSYTTFSYSDLHLSADRIALDGTVDATFTLTNTGDVAGAEVAQVYLRAPKGRLARSPQDLVGFAKVPLQAGESREVTITLTGRDMAIWDPSRSAWVLQAGEAMLTVSASSRDVRLTAALMLDSPVSPHRKLAFDTQPTFVLPNPIARAAIRDFIAERTGISPEDADRALEHGANSFIGIFATLERRLRLTIRPHEVEELIARVNARMDEA